MLIRSDSLTIVSISMQFIRHLGRIRILRALPEAHTWEICSPSGTASGSAAFQLYITSIINSKRKHERPPGDPALRQVKMCHPGPARTNSQTQGFL